MSRTWSVVVAAIALLVVAFGGYAQNARAVRKTAEATMLVTGNIEINPDGRVQRFSLDQPDNLPPETRGFLAKVIPLWIFEPIEQPGASAVIHSRMSVRLVAEPVGDGYEMRVRSASFGGDPQPGETVTGKVMTPPVYPRLAAQVHATGTVFLILEIGRDGKVIHVDAAQTNLNVVARNREMELFRKQFEQAALSAAKDWSFQIPTVGPTAANKSWVVRVPVSYEMRDHKQPSYGTWQSYIPGPRNPIPWLGAKIAADQDQGLEAGMNGQISQLGYGPQLRTRLVDAS